MDNEDKFEYPFANEASYSEALKSIPKIRGMREWINERTDILFVAEKLPLDGDGKPMFGPNTMKIVHTMYLAGLLEEDYDHPLTAERDIFVFQGITERHREERYPYSLVSFTEVPVYLNSFMVKGNLQHYCFRWSDWTRILDMLKPLEVEKVAILGKKMIRKANEWIKQDRDSKPKYGFLFDYKHNGHRAVPFYGLPITALNDEAVEYYRILKNERRR